MRTIAIVTLSALAIMASGIAYAAGGAVSGPLNAATPATSGVPASSAEPVIPPSPTPTIGSGTALGVGGPNATRPVPGEDTSTAAPGGQAESTKNGALSTPADGDKTAAKHQKSHKTTPSNDTNPG